MPETSPPNAPPRIAITALVHTRNEEAHIGDCLASLSWADEVVVADMASTDRTRQIAAQHGAGILEVPLAPIVEQVRQLAIAQCRGDWVFLLDADERVPAALPPRLRQFAAAGQGDALALPRRNYFLGVWLEHGLWPDYQTRFFRRDKIRWPTLVHEHPEVLGRLVQHPANPAEAIEHVGYVTDLGAFLEKLARYSKHDARRLLGTYQPPVWPFLLRRPLGEFYGRYFRCQAWRHGLHGLAWSLIMGLYQLEVALNYWALQPPSSPAGLEPRKLRARVRYEALRANSKWLKFW